MVTGKLNMRNKTPKDREKGQETVPCPLLIGGTAQDNAFYMESLIENENK